MLIPSDQLILMNLKTKPNNFLTGKYTIQHPKNMNSKDHSVISYKSPPRALSERYAQLFNQNDSESFK